MGLNHSPRIVTNGLTLTLDAGNTKSYPGSGTTWTDLSGNGYNGTLTAGITYSTSNGGYFTVPDGNQYISVPAASFTLPADFTMEAWFMLTSTPNGSVPSVIFSSWSSNEGSANSRYIVFVTSDLVISAEIKGQNARLSHQNTLALNNWYHVALVRKSGTFQLFLNGIGSTTTRTSSTSLTLVLDTWIGNYSASFNNSMKGRISLFRVYKDYGLTETEIQQNFNALRGRFGI